jgi:hypothetical protein
MSTSIHRGIVEINTSHYGTDDDPIDTVTARDGILNGLLHCGDSMGQVRVNYMPIASAAANGQDAFETIEASPIANQWYRVGAAPFGEWPLTCRWDRTPYKLVVRLGAATSSAAGTTTFRVVICPMMDAIAELDREVDHVWETSFAGTTTIAWRTGASQGSTASATLITVSRANALAWLRDVPIYDAVSSASPRSVQQCLVAAHVFAKTSNTGALPRLHALFIDEYVGT